jgi:hypothetical protein
MICVEMGEACSMYEGRRGEEHTGFWWGDTKERNCCEEAGLDRII